MGFFSYFDDLWKIIDLRNTNQHFQDGLFIWDIKTFNESAIRESILNAISHRDYRMGASVYIRQFPDKIEITNPGGLPHGITFENILWQQSPRNRLIADVFSKCGLVERSGQGMNRIYETCISESKGVPDFDHSDENNFWITLHGKIQNIEFLKVLEKIGQRRVRLFNADDLLILLNIFDNQPIPLRLNKSAEKLSDEGLLEKKPNSRGLKWVLARKLYVAVGQAGVHTIKKGLDRDTNKELLLNHIKLNGKNGAKMEELRQVLPSFSRSNVLSLLRSLRKDGLITSKGERRGAKWFLVE
jgi:ATP-dependent DNA helicase RecG